MQSEKRPPAKRPVGPKFTYKDFVQRVRRYRTSDVIRALATIPTEHFEPGTPMPKWRTVNPWAAAAIAREALVCGNENRERHVLSSKELNDLFIAFGASHDETGDALEDVVLNIMTRHAYEQFSSQESVIEELSRAVILFQGGIDGDHKIICDEVERVLGFTVGDAISAAVVLFGATTNPPWLWNADSVREENVEDLFDFISKDTIVKFAQMLTLNQADYRGKYITAMPGMSQGDRISTVRWGFNPVPIYPLIRLSDGTVIAVQRWLILRRLSPQYLYYDAIDRGDTVFTNALGNVIEAYVGRQLNNIEGGRVLDKFVYHRKKEELESIDWFLDLPSCMVYVESKSARLTLSARMADKALVSNLKRDLGKAFRQLNSTYEVIHADLAKYEDRHLGKPIIGLVITPEPIYSGNSTELRRHLPGTKMKVLVGSLRDLEMIATLPGQELGDELLQIVADPEKSTWVLASALRSDRERIPNPILDEAAKLLPIFKWSPIEEGGSVQG